MLSTKSVSAENQFAGPIEIKGLFGVSIQSTNWGSTIVTLQRSFDGVTYNDIDTYTSNLEAVDWEPGRSEWGESVYYRLGVKTGAYDSGPVVCTIYQ